MKVRKEKLDNLIAEGKNPFEITKFNRTNSAGEIKANYEQVFALQHLKTPKLMVK